jgi:hypothetical protein
MRPGALDRHFASAGNGGEYRKSYHGFPSPVAYVIDSPQSVYCNAMFIDTWNREMMNATGSKFVPGPLPKRSLAPEGATYSGLLECPMSDKIQKLIPGGGGYDPTYPPTTFECASDVTACEHAVRTAQACFDAAQDAVGASTPLSTSQGASATLPAGCTVTYGGGKASAYFNTAASNRCCGAGVEAVAGEASSLVRVQMVIGVSTINVTLTGPADVWFGVGFFAQAMEDAPYALVVDGHGAVSERQLATHMGAAASPAGTLLAPSVTVLSSSVAAGKRTLVLSRAARGASAQHASFSVRNLTIPFVNALGVGADLAFHSNKTASTLELWPAAPAPVCVCEVPAAPFGSAVGNIKYTPTGEQFGFIRGCSPEPRESILASRNPTCDVRAYVGGLQVCKHMWSLVDEAQGQPWESIPLIYYQKYRFYFQEFDPRLHVVSVPRSVWAIGAFIGEYDVPPCAAGIPADKCTHEIWGVLTPGGDQLHIAAIHFHCHAPTCLAMEIRYNKTGTCLQRDSSSQSPDPRAQWPADQEIDTSRHAAGTVARRCTRASCCADRSRSSARAGSRTTSSTRRATSCSRPACGGTRPGSSRCRSPAASPSPSARRPTRRSGTTARWPSPR